MPVRNLDRHELNRRRTVLTKLFQESGTRGSFNQAAVNPETGKGLRLEDGGKAILETAFGRITAEIRFDASIMPGIVSVAVGPAKRASGKRRSREEASVLNICRLDEDYTWRVTPATVREG